MIKLGNPETQLPAPTETLQIPPSFLMASIERAIDETRSSLSAEFIGCLDLTGVSSDEIYGSNLELKDCLGNCDLVIINDDLDGLVDIDDQVFIQRVDRLKVLLNEGGRICSFTLHDNPSDYMEKLEKEGFLTIIIDGCPNGKDNQNCVCYLSRKC